MNAMNIMKMAMLYFQLNAGQSHRAKLILKEGMDGVSALSQAMKDNKITMAEKKLLVKELREFSKASIDTLDSITIPTPRKKKTTKK